MSGAISKPQIAFEGKARADEKAQAYTGSMLSPANGGKEAINAAIGR